MELPQILLVEDEPIIMDLVASVLRDEGFAVVCAATGAEALEKLHGEPGLRGLVTDVRLPSSVSGWELARTARGIFPDIAVVYATGHGETEWTAEGVPGSVLITKPFAPAQVVAALAKQLNAERPS